MSRSVEFSWRSEDFKALIETCKYEEELTPRILAYMPKMGKILEAGCGLARYVYFLAEKGFDITGVELNRDTVEAVKRLAPHLDVRQGDISGLDFEDNSISGIICLGVIEHFPEGVQEPLREFFRVLKKDAYAVITVPSFNYLRRIKYRLGKTLGFYQFNPVKIIHQSPVIRRLFRKRPIKKYCPPRIPYARRHGVVRVDFFEYMFTKDEFETELEKAGFSIVESVPFALMDGMFHELGSFFVKFDDKDMSFQPNLFGRGLNKIFSFIPYFHNHMHLCVVKK